MNIQESNKLIAEFDGWVVSKQGKTLRKIGKDPRSSPYRWSDIHYHTSWDWLMPVIEKIGLDIFEENINELGDFDHCYPRTFGMMNKEREYMFRFNRYSLHSDAKLINAAYCAVVEYIQSLNP